MGRICLAVTMDSVQEVVRRVVALVDEAGLSPERSYRLRLAAEEIATNIVVHGYGEAPVPPPEPGFYLEWGSDEERVWVRLEDGARPFDPTRVPQPANLGDPLAERQEGGLGIHLVRDALDEFSYRRAGGHNHVLLAIRRA